jgi:hypothetical protein
VHQVGAVAGGAPQPLVAQERRSAGAADDLDAVDAAAADQVLGLPAPRALDVHGHEVDLLDVVRAALESSDPRGPEPTLTSG